VSVVKKWDRELENRTDPLLKQVTQLQWFLASDIARAIAYLGQAVKTLDAYAAVVQPKTSAALAGAKVQADKGREKRR
jgi:hypothetical protein